MQISEAQNKLAGKLVDLVATKLGSGRAVHTETAIASISRLAGSMLFRSFNLNVSNAQPGELVLSAEASEEGPQLVNILGSMLQHFGISLDPEKLGGEPLNRGGAPTLSVVESLILLQDDAMQIARDSGLEMREVAVAAAMATAFIVKECSANIGAEVAFNGAAYGLIEGCKTVPPVLGTKPTQKPWYKFW